MTQLDKITSALSRAAALQGEADKIGVEYKRADERATSAIDARDFPEASRQLVAMTKLQEQRIAKTNEVHDVLLAAKFDSLDDPRERH